MWRRLPPARLRVMPGRQIVPERALQSLSLLPRLSPLLHVPPHQYRRKRLRRP